MHPYREPLGGALFIVHEACVDACTGKRRTTSESAVESDRCDLAKGREALLQRQARCARLRTGGIAPPAVSEAARA